MRGAGDGWKLRHRPALEGVRGIAIALVLACHVSIPHLDGAGAVGVSVFFVLSGFLITALLLEERERSGRTYLAGFYQRRARRLLPALLASTAAVIAVSPWLRPWWFRWADLTPVLLYFGNWIEADPHADLAALGGTWSLAIEEQFYFLWPLVVMGLAKSGRRAVLAGGIAGAAASLGVRVALIADGVPSDRVYYGTDCVALALLAGAALAAWRSTRPPGPSRPKVALLSLSLIIAVSAWSALAAAYIALPVTAAATVILIWASVGSSSALRALAAKPLVWLGRRSYGIYLWHCPLAWGLRIHAEWSWPMLVAVVVPVSLGLAEMSYRWIEQPWLRSSRGRLRQERGSRAHSRLGSGHQPALDPAMPDEA